MSNYFEGTKSVAFDEETRLVELSSQGDQTSFLLLYQKYYNKVFAISKGILLDTEEAEDCTQEIFSLAYRNMRRFDKRAKFSTWLFKIAINRSIQQGRKVKNNRKNVSLNDDAENIPANPSSNVENENPFVEAALEKLTEAERAILTLFYWDDLTLQEIGESIGCSPNAAKTRLFRAREKFKEAYQEVEK